jgi:hypothetical protein
MTTLHIIFKRCFVFPNLPHTLVLGVCFVVEDPKEREYLRQILLGAAAKLSLMKLRHNGRSRDEGVNRLKDEMT